MHYMMERVCPVQDSLNSMSMPTSLPFSPTWAKVNSRRDRTVLMNRMKKRKLDGDACFILFLLFSQIKIQTNVLKAMDTMSAEDKAQRWFSPPNLHRG
jgi:hypothetical protein